VANRPLPRRRIRPHRVAAPQQGEPRLVAAAHVLQKGRGGGHVLFQHLRRDLDLGQWPAGMGQLLQVPAVGRQQQVQPVQLGQVAGDGLAGLPRRIRFGHRASLRRGRLRED
jgi:hypothetical protein